MNLGLKSSFLLVFCENLIVNVEEGLMCEKNYLLVIKHA